MMSSEAILSVDRKAARPLRDAAQSAGGEELRSKHARAGKAMALATLAMAAASGLQALLYLRSFGVNARTDGFFAAFALYAVFGVFCQSIRVTSAPLLVGSRPSIAPRQFAAALALIALPVILLTGPLAGPVAGVLAPGLREVGRHVTESALPILGVAMVLQLWAAGAATVLAVRDRFAAIASAYGLGAFAGIVVYLALQGTAGELTLGWSMLAMAIATFTVLAAGLRRAPATAQITDASALRPRNVVACAASILGRTGIYLAFNALYLVTLAFAGHYRAGDATVVSYSYLFASYLVAATGFALGMARVADMTRGAQTEQQDVLGNTVPSGFRYAMLLSAPTLAGLVAFGAPLIGAVLPASLNASQVTSLQRFGLLCVPWVIAAQLVNLMLPVMFARGRTRLVNFCAPALVAAHLALTALGAALFGLNGVVGAMFIAPLGFALFMFGAEARGRLRELADELGRDGGLFLALAAASFGGAALITLAVPSGAARSLLCGLLGGVAYLAGLRIFAGHQLQMLLSRGGDTPTDGPRPRNGQAAPPVPVSAAANLQAAAPAGAVASTPAVPTSPLAAPSGSTRRQSSHPPQSSRARQLALRWLPVALLVLVGAGSMAKQWDGHILWERDGLFYEAQVLELKGESKVAALDQVFYGPLGSWSRQLESQQPASEPKRQANHEWPLYSSRFYERRLLLPAVAAALQPLLGVRALQTLSLLGYVLLGPLLYALLRRRFRRGTSLLVALCCLALGPVRGWSIYPLTDSWGLAFEVLSFLIALHVLDRERPSRRWLASWLVPWMLVVLALSFTRDTAFIPVLAAGVVTLFKRSRASIVLTLSGILAALPAPLLYSVGEREQLAYVFNQHNIPINTSWSWVISHYFSNIGTMFSEYAHFAVHDEPLTVLVFVVGVVLAILCTARRVRRDATFQVVLAGAGLGYLALLVVGPSFSRFRYELVLVPIVAYGLALGCEWVAQLAGRRAERSLRAGSPPERGVALAGGLAADIEG
jgi:peptidoglycan biosynthesis protein MviN/MurJ (putative lipid II flippase)